MKNRNLYDICQWNGYGRYRISLSSHDSELNVRHEPLMYDSVIVYNLLSSLLMIENELESSAMAITLHVLFQ